MTINSVYTEKIINHNPQLGAREEGKAMEVKVVFRSEKEAEACDYRSAMKIEVDGEKKFIVHDGEPEDSNMSRDFNDVLKIPELMQLAHEAGVRGEPFELTQAESDDL